MPNDEFVRIDSVFDPQQMAPGVALEEFLFEYLKHEIQTHRFPFVRERCKLYRGKRYWSDARQAYIPCDVTVEVFLDDDAEAWSLLWVWECKDWSRPVPVGVFEEFHAKIQQLGPGGIKGTLVACNGLTAPAFNFAKRNRIGVFKVEVSCDYQEARVRKVLYAPGSVVSENPIIAILKAGQEAAFVPPDTVLISHDAGAGLAEYLDDALTELVGASPSASWRSPRRSELIPWARTENQALATQKRGVGGGICNALVLRGGNLQRAGR